MVDETKSSVMTEINAIAKLFGEGEKKVADGEKKKSAALSDLNALYLRAVSDDAIRTIIDQAFDALIADGKPKKCKALSHRASWLAFSRSKQRASEAHRLLSGAEGLAIQPEAFSDWLAENGGMKATLKMLASRRTGSGRTDDEKLAKTVGNAFEKIEQNASNRAVLSDPPKGMVLTEGETYIRCVSLQGGRYVQVDAVLGPNGLSFPKAEKEPITPKETLKDLAKHAKVTSEQDAPAVSNAA